MSISSKICVTAYYPRPASHHPPTSETIWRVMNRTALLYILAAVPAIAQPPQQRAPIISPEVHADHTVTFRFRAPNAKEVFLAREGAPRVAMQKDSEGLWSLTTDPLPPDIYGYSFV